MYRPHLGQQEVHVDHIGQDEEASHGGQEGAGGHHHGTAGRGAGVGGEEVGAEEG